MKVNKITPPPDSTPVASIEVTQKELDYLLALVAHVTAGSMIGGNDSFSFYDKLKSAGGDHYNVVLTDSESNSSRTGLPLFNARHKGD